MIILILQVKKIRFREFKKKKQKTYPSHSAIKQNARIQIQNIYIHS